MPTENNLPEGYRDMADQSQAEEIADESAMALQAIEKEKAATSKGKGEDDSGAERAPS